MQDHFLLPGASCFGLQRTAALRVLHHVPYYGEIEGFVISVGLYGIVGTIAEGDLCCFEQSSERRCHFTSMSWRREGTIAMVTASA